MMIWVDAQLSPEIAEFIESTFGIESRALKSLGLRDSKDNEIFAAARQANAIVMTKDEDFSILLERFGPPPKIIWVTCGNTSNQHLQSRITVVAVMREKGRPGYWLDRLSGN